MADKYWSGLGVADGTVMSTGNVMTTGNTDADGTIYNVVYDSTGTPTITYARPAQPAGPGVSITGSSTAAFSRLEPSSPAARGMALQVLYTPSGTPTADAEIVIGRTASDSGFASMFLHLTTGVFRIRNQVGTGLSSSPVLVANHTYQIDILNDLNSGTPSTTNGRIVVRLKDLTDATWNTTGEFFYDSGYSVNVGTVQLGRWRVGKASTPGLFPQAYFTGLRWGERQSIDTSTDPEITSAQFISTYKPPTDIPPNIPVSPASVARPIVAISVPGPG